MSAVATVESLRARLRTVMLRLAGRQLARAAVHGLVASGLVTVCAVLLVVALPLLLGIEFPGGAAVAVVAGGVTLLAATLRKVVRMRLPNLRDAALVLEARLADDDGALATALEMDGGDRFRAPVLRRATESLLAGLALPAPNMLATRELLLAPLLVVAATVALMWAFNVEGPAATSARVPEVGNRAAFSLDVATGRDGADGDARAQAMGLKRAAAAMSDATDTMRSESASQAQRQAALDDARKAARESSDSPLAQAAEDLPELAPSEKAEREALAVRLESLAAGAGDRSGGNGSAEGGAGDSGSGAAGTEQRFVPFPKLNLSASVTPVEALAAQTPERRALAHRAMQEFER